MRELPRRLPVGAPAWLAGFLTLAQSPRRKVPGSFGGARASVKACRVKLRFLWFSSWLPRAAELRVTSFVAAGSFPAVEPGVARRRFADQAVESPDELARRKSCDRPGEWSFPEALPGRSGPHPELPS